MPKVDGYKSSYPVYCNAENIDMLSIEGYFSFRKERSLIGHG